MLTKEQLEEQEIQEIEATISKVKDTIYGLCLKIGEINPEVLEFIVRNPDNFPSKADIVAAYPEVILDTEMAYNIVELYKIFNFRIPELPQSVKNNLFMPYIMREGIFPEALSEVRASLFDTAPASEISTSTLDTAMETNSSVLHGSSEYCEL